MKSPPRKQSPSTSKAKPQPPAADAQPAGHNPFSSDLARRLLEANTLNLVRKLSRGHTLAPHEVKALEARHQPVIIGRVFDSIAQAAAATGHSKSFLRSIKSAGCPAFRGARVYENELNSWLATHKPTHNNSAESLKAREKIARVKLLEEQAHRETIARRKDERDLVEWSDVDKVLREILLPIRQRILALPNECASLANPTNPAQARDALQAWSDRSLATIQTDTLRHAP